MRILQLCCGIGIQLHNFLSKHALLTFTQDYFDKYFSFYVSSCKLIIFFLEPTRALGQSQNHSLVYHVDMIKAPLSESVACVLCIVYDLCICLLHVSMYHELARPQIVCEKLKKENKDLTYYLHELADPPMSLTNEGRKTSYHSDAWLLSL